LLDVEVSLSLDHGLRAVTVFLLKAAASARRILIGLPGSRLPVLGGRESLFLFLLSFFLLLYNLCEFVENGRPPGEVLFEELANVRYLCDLHG